MPRIQRTVLYYIVYSCVGIAVGYRGPLLQILSDELSLNLSQIALVIPIRYSAYILSNFFWGYYYDKHRGNNVLSLGLFINACAFLFLPLTISIFISIGFILFIGLCIINGIGEASLDLGCNTLLIWNHHGNHMMPRYIIGIHLCFGIGGTLSSTLLTLFNIYNINPLFISYGLGALMIIYCILAFLLLSPKKPYTHNNTTDPSLKNTQNKLMIGSLLLLFGIFISSEVTIQQWLYSYILQKFQLNNSIAASILNIYWISFTLSRFLLIFAPARLQAKHVLFCCTIGIIITCILLLTTYNILLIWISCSIIGILSGLCTPTLFTFAEKRIHITGKITSYLFISIGICNLVIPYITSVFMEKISMNMFSITIINLMILNFILLFFITTYVEKHTHKS